MSGNGFNVPGLDPNYGQMVPQMASWGQPMGPANYSMAPIAQSSGGLQIPTAQASSMFPGMGGAAPAGGGGGFSDMPWLSTNTQQGLLSGGLGAAQGLMNAFLGWKQYGIAKDTLKENKRQFEMNYDAQRRTTNASLEDRQRARVASNAGAYQSVGSYMDQNRIQ